MSKRIESLATATQHIPHEFCAVNFLIIRKKDRDY